MARWCRRTTTPWSAHGEAELPAWGSNLFEAKDAETDRGPDGPFSQHAHRWDPWLWVSMRGDLLLAGLLTVACGAVAAAIAGRGAARPGEGAAAHIARRAVQPGDGAAAQPGEARREHTDEVRGCPGMTFDDVVDLLDETEVVAIVTTRANGAPIATPIWSMVIGGVPYLRSAYGADSWWYRHVRAGRPVAFARGDGSIAERDRAAALELPREAVAITQVPAEDEVQALLDEEILRKYVGAPQSSIDAMLSAEAIACTLRVEPAAG